MDYKKLTEALTNAIAGIYDADFLPVIESIHCMSRPRVYAVLNAIVSSMDPDEIYTECGTYQGGSLVSALLGNQAKAIAMDSFEEFTQTNSYEMTRSNLEKFGVLDRVQLLNTNFQDFFAGLPHGFKIQTYYYDGAHGYEVQLAGMEAAWKFLQKGSIIVVDDYIYREVRLAVNQFVANHINEVAFLTMFNPVHPTDETWWNGICVLQVV